MTDDGILLFAKSAQRVNEAPLGGRPQRLKHTSPKQIDRGVYKMLAVSGEQIALESKLYLRPTVLLLCV